MGKARVRIADELLLDLFTKGKHEGYEVIDGAIPEGARAVDIKYNDFHDPHLIEICVESPELPGSPPGMMLPDICPVLATTTEPCFDAVPDPAIEELPKGEMLQEALRIPETPTDKEKIKIEVALDMEPGPIKEPKVKALPGIPRPW